MHFLAFSSRLILSGNYVFVGLLIVVGVLFLEFAFPEFAFLLDFFLEDFCSPLILFLKLPPVLIFVFESLQFVAYNRILNYNWKFCRYRNSVVVFF